MRSRRWAAVLILAIVACGKGASNSAPQALLSPGGTTPTGSCATTAVPVPGVDNRVAIQTALDGQGCAHLGCGAYDIGVDDTGTGQMHLANLNLRGGMALTGEGPCTVLHFTGTWASARDGVRLYGARNLLAELSVDTSDIDTSDEQTHAVEVVGNATLTPTPDLTTDANTIESVWINHPAKVVNGVTQTKGDCLRLLGEQAYPVKRTLVEGNQFYDCKRSGIGVQRGVYGLTISGNAFLGTTDQAIDGEQSGSSLNGRIVIDANVFYATSGKYFIAMSGTETADFVVTGNVLSGQGFYCYNCRRVTATGNVIMVAAPANADAAVTFYKASGPVVFANNVVVRGAGTAGAVVAIQPQCPPQGAPCDTAAPSNLSVTGNYLFQGTSAVGINALSVKGAVVENNLVELGAGLAGPHAIKFSRGATTDPTNDNLLITGNEITGPWQIGVTLQNTARATLGHNAMDATPGAKGLSCAASTTGPIVSSANNWTASSCAMATGGGI